MKTYLKSIYRPKIAHGKTLHTDSLHSVTDRQELIPGFNQKALSEAEIVLIGAGGINSVIGYGNARKGVGCQKIFDDDEVETTNLNRQFFFERDIGKPKGEQLAINLAIHAFCGTEFAGYGLSFQDALAFDPQALKGDIAVVGVDNGQTRVDTSVFYREAGIPVIFIAVDLVGQSGYVFVQESKPDTACFGCKFPKTLNSQKAPCRTAAVIDILQVVGGIAGFSVNSILMNRKRNWNYREFHIAGFAPDVQLIVEKIKNCPLCG